MFHHSLNNHSLIICDQSVIICQSVMIIHWLFINHVIPLINQDVFIDEMHFNQSLAHFISFANSARFRARNRGISPASRFNIPFLPALSRHHSWMISCFTQDTSRVIQQSFMVIQRSVIIYWLMHDWNPDCITAPRAKPQYTYIHQSGSIRMSSIQFLYRLGLSRAMPAKRYFRAHLRLCFLPIPASTDSS